MRDAKKLVKAARVLGISVYGENYRGMRWVAHAQAIMLEKDIFNEFAQRLEDERDAVEYEASLSE